MFVPSVVRAARLIRAISSGVLRSASGSAIRPAQNSGYVISSVTPGR